MGMHLLFMYERRTYVFDVWVAVIVEAITSDDKKREAPVSPNE